MTTTIEAKADRQIGVWGTTSRFALGAIFLYLVVRQGVGWDDAIIGLAIFPAAVVVVLALRGQNASPLRLVGPGGYGLNFLIWGIAFGTAPVPTLLFAGAAQLLAGTIGYAGCELFAVSNLLRGRDDQIACPVHSPIDAWEARTNDQRPHEVC